MSATGGQDPGRPRAPDPPPEEGGLRRTALSGGIYLALRETLGVGVRLGGVLAITRLLGAERFGAYAGAAAIVVVLGNVAQLGSEVYLIRRPQEPSRSRYDAVFTLMLATGTALAALALGVSFVVEAVVGPSPFFAPFRVLLVALPLNVLWAPAQAKLERRFDFRSLAVLEVGGDLVLYGVGVPLAVLGAGTWAPVAGYISWQTFLLVGAYTMARYRPRLCWSPLAFRETARFGLAFSGANWLDNARDLVNPLVVGGLLGPAAVGQVAVVVRLCDTLSFVNRATRRLSMVAFGRVQDDLSRLRRGLEEGAALQLLALGPVMAGFSLVAPVVIPLIFGETFRPAVELFPFVAAGFFANGLFDLQASALAVVGRNAAVARINALRTGLLALGALALIPALGLRGYGWAALAPIAALALSVYEIRRVAPLRYERALPWVAAFGPAVFAALLPFPASLLLFLPTVVVVLLPAVRRQLREDAELVRSSLLRRRAV